MERPGNSKNQNQAFRAEGLGLQNALQFRVSSLGFSRTGFHQQSASISQPLVQAVATWFATTKLLASPHPAQIGLVEDALNPKLEP